MRLRKGLETVDKVGQTSFAFTDYAPKLVPAGQIKPEDALVSSAGKAGAQNFAVLLLWALFEDRPGFFAINDARHCFRKKLFLEALPHFFVKRGGRLVLDEEIYLVQVRQSILHRDDREVVDGEFIGIFQEYAMTVLNVMRAGIECVTSCGTNGVFRYPCPQESVFGGHWTTRLPHYFLELCQIEDTLTSHAFIIHGFRSRYVNKVLSRGIRPDSAPKFLVASLRWITGAIVMLYIQLRHGKLLNPFTLGWKYFVIWENLLYPFTALAAPLWILIIWLSAMTLTSPVGGDVKLVAPLMLASVLARFFSTLISSSFHQAGSDTRTTQKPGQSMWRIPDGVKLHDRAEQRFFYQWPLFLIAFFVAGSQLATLCAGGDITFWNATGGSGVRKIFSTPNLLTVTLLFFALGECVVMAESLWTCLAPIWESQTGLPVLELVMHIVLGLPPSYIIFALLGPIKATVTHWLPWKGRFVVHRMPRIVVALLFAMASLIIIALQGK
mmetsp:Transcript_60448/g.143017  ORF Transcript_60448/g.143017 Transcript_60448/m.143017 type:complete len:497 (-) Transcript_60448:28-1518(-)